MEKAALNAAFKLLIHVTKYNIKTNTVLFNRIHNIYNKEKS